MKQVGDHLDSSINLETMFKGMKKKMLGVWEELGAVKTVHLQKGSGN